MKAPVLAVDMGGTKILAAIISDKYQVLAREYQPTLASEGPQAVIRRLLAAFDRLLSSQKMGPSELGAISLAIAGGMDTEKGLVTSSPNLPGWHDVPLRDMVGEHYGVPTLLVNDSSAAALGEYRLGAGKGTRNMVMLTVGTGIGGGIIIEGKLYTGSSGSAGEIGHMAIDVSGPKCKCGNIGCLEMLASGTAMAREAIRRIRDGQQSILIALVGGNIENITAREVGTAARNGDALAADVILEAATYLGIGLVNMVNIFNPEVIVIGGSVAKLGDLLLEPARQVVKERAFRISANLVRIVPAQLGDDAGVLGAAVFARQRGTK
ncbi:MAG: ROK family protein [Chloroflexota bacterium]|nr:ROK family protein [Chloroflexota bacterium]